MRGSFNTSITRLDFPQPVIPCTTTNWPASNFFKSFDNVITYKYKIKLNTKIMI